MTTKNSREQKKERVCEKIIHLKMQKQCRRRRADDSPLFMLLFPELLSANYHVVHNDSRLNFLFRGLDFDSTTCVLESSADFSGKPRSEIIFGDLIVKKIIQFGFINKTQFFLIFAEFPKSKFFRQKR